MCAVAFEDTWYLGRVDEIKSNTAAKVSFMKRVGFSYFKWPNKIDSRFIENIYLLKKDICISPKDSSLRIWECVKETCEKTDALYLAYKHRYFQ